ncbi:MAG TPA: quinoprotein relay system zinc metallohydrolase 2 [Methylibium sp.]|nr:quinoprotein relay system zinc metallohydrolase 2 [Methylibium sp.]
MASRVLALVAALLPALAGAVAPLPVREIAPGVHVHVGAVEVWGPANGGDVGNLGFVVGQRCVAVIDTGGSVAIGAALQAAVRRVTDKPVCWVVNTHVHPDHLLGNQAFEAPGTAFVGHHRLPAALGARAPFYLNQLQRDFGSAAAGARFVAPTELVRDTLRLDLGGRALTLRAWPTSHTDGDLTVYDEASGTLFLGDLLFRDHLPVVDGKLKGWLATMAALARLPAARVVPGHGEPSTDWPGVLAPQRAYLEGLAADVRAALKAGWTLGQALERVPLAPAPWRLREDFHVRNVTAAYAELEWED